MKHVKIAELIGSPIAVAAEDGQLVFETISNELHSSESIRLSFEGVSMLTSAFLNAAIGQLYGSFERSVIRKFLKLEDLSDEDAAYIKRIADLAQEYFRSPDQFKHSADFLLT